MQMITIALALALALALAMALALALAMALALALNPTFKKERNLPVGISIQVKCDCCGKVKEQMNHWFMLSSASNHFTIDKLEVKLAEQFNYTLLCGETCLFKYLSANLSSKLYPPTRAEETKP